MAFQQYDFVLALPRIHTNVFIRLPRDSGIWLYFVECFWQVAVEPRHLAATRLEQIMPSRIAM
jgi:hypothetical protein